MHMADALLNPAVGGVMCAVSAGALAAAVKKQKPQEEKKLPMMAVTGAFVFAAQMINFTIPGTGSSGHIGGGMLLSAILGGPAALLTMAVVLIIQCLIFADGGLLALGCNVFNMGVIPCLLVYPLLFKPLLRNRSGPGRLMAASILAVVVSLQLGAFGVVLQTAASGIAALPFSTFVVLMQPIHLAIGLVEGVVTGAVLCYVQKAQPELLDVHGTEKAEKNHSMRKQVVVFAAAALLLAGGVSLLASSLPDGLEWAMEKTAGTAELPAEGTVLEGAAQIQETTAVMPDYGVPMENETVGASLAGIAGAVITFALAGGVGLLIVTVKRKTRNGLQQSGERTGSGGGR